MNPSRYIVYSFSQKSIRPCIGGLVRRYLRYVLYMTSRSQFFLFLWGSFSKLVLSLYIGSSTNNILQYVPSGCSRTRCTKYVNQNLCIRITKMIWVQQKFGIHEFSCCLIAWINYHSCHNFLRELFITNPIKISMKKVFLRKTNLMATGKLASIVLKKPKINIFNDRSLFNKNVNQRGAPFVK